MQWVNARRQASIVVITAREEDSEKNVINENNKIYVICHKV